MKSRRLATRSCAASRSGSTTSETAAPRRAHAPATRTRRSPRSPWSSLSRATRDFRSRPRSVHATATTRTAGSAPLTTSSSRSCPAHPRTSRSSTCRRTRVFRSLTASRSTARKSLTTLAIQMLVRTAVPSPASDADADAWRRGGHAEIANTGCLGIFPAVVHESAAGSPGERGNAHARTPHPRRTGYRRAARARWYAHGVEPRRWADHHPRGAAVRVVIAEELVLPREGLERLLRAGGADVGMPQRIDTSSEGLATALHKCRSGRSADRATAGACSSSVAGARSRRAVGCRDPVLRVLRYQA